MTLVKHTCLIQGIAASACAMTDSSDQTVTDGQIDRQTDRQWQTRTQHSQSGCQEAAFVFGLLSDINGLDEVHIQHPPPSGT